jgi:hypothetical protein
MEGKPPVIAACHFHFRLLQILSMYELWRLLLHIFELHCAQLDEDNSIVHLFPREKRNLF